jgi:tRNA(fMet)-specific endonuclease VapC
MRAILIDTNAYAAFKLADPSVCVVLSAAERILVSVVVLGELLGGFAAGSRESRNRLELSRFLDSPRVEMDALTPQTADNYALVYDMLRREGRPIPGNDLWIAATALEHGAALLSLDAHFGSIDGLRLGGTIDDFLP